MTINSLDVLLSQFGTSLLFHVQFSLLLLDLHTGFSGGKLIRYSHLLKNVPEFVVFHAVKDFRVVNETEIDVLLELSCFFNDTVDFGNLTFGSSAFSKSSLNIWMFSVHLLLKPGLEDFEHYFVSV